MAARAMVPAAMPCSALRSCSRCASPGVIETLTLSVKRSWWSMLRRFAMSAHHAMHRMLRSGELKVPQFA